MSRKIGALWLKETQDGKKYMSGVLNDISGDISIAIFKNDRKEKENHPDYSIVLSEKRQNRESGNSAPTQENTTGEQTINVDDIPF